MAIIILLKKGMRFFAKSFISFAVSGAIIVLSSNNQIFHTYYDISYTNTKLEGIPIGYQDLEIKAELIKGLDEKLVLEELQKTGCESWEISLISLKNILKKMRKVEATEWYAVCYNYPCWYESKVSNDKVEYDFHVNAASYITLSNENETLHFILEEPSEIFLTACDCCEYEKP